MSNRLRAEKPIQLATQKVSPIKLGGYVAHDAVCQIVLPSPRRLERFFFTLEEVQEILAPYHTFNWLAAETGLRAGELCGFY